jgi:hypothetical protein
MDETRRETSDANILLDGGVIVYQAYQGNAIIIAQHRDRKMRRLQLFLGRLG